MHLALLAAIMLFACAPSTKEQQAGLEAAYREAHGAKDLGRLENLVVWGEAQELEREVFRGVARFDFDLPIGRIEFKPLEANQPLTYERGGVTYAPVLPPAGWMEVTFAVPPGQPHGLTATSTRYLVAPSKDGYRIVTTAPQRRPG